MQAEADHELGSAATALTRDRFGRPGLGRAGSGPPLTCPSGAVVSGPDLSAPYLREEDPPCCRRWRRARDALRAQALRRRHGSGAGQAGGRCIMSRAGALYIIAAIDEAAAGRGPGVPARRAAAHQAPASGRSGGGMLVRARGCWRRCAAALGALAAEVAGAAPGSARRRRRTDHSPAGRQRRVIACGRRQAPADWPCRRYRARRRRFRGQAYRQTRSSLPIRDVRQASRTATVSYLMSACSGFGFLASVSVTGSQQCQAEHDAAGRGAGGAAVITSVRYHVQVWRLPFADALPGSMRDTRPCTRSAGGFPPACAIGAETADSGSSAVGADADAAP